MNNNSNFSDSHQNTLAIQEIKEQVIYMTEVLKGDRNFLNKHFQNAITNYFMEDYASQFLKEKMGLKTYKEVKNVIAQKLEEKQKQESSGTKYMNLINIYYQEHTNQGTLEQYQDYLRQLAFSNDDKHYQKGSQEWVTISWKKATALFVLHHTLNTHLSSIFEIWNSLYPEDPIIKKKKTREERDKERLKEQIKEQESGDVQDASVKKGKKGIQKNKTPIDRSALTKQKDIQLWRKNNKKQSPRNSDQDEFENNSDEKDSHNSGSDNIKDQQAKFQAAQRKKSINNNKQCKNPQEEQEANVLVESAVDVQDSIHMFKKRLIEQNGGEGFDDFLPFEYIPMNPKQNNQDYTNAQSIVVQGMDQEKLKEEYHNGSLLGGMDIEQSKDKDAIFRSLVLAKGFSQQQNNGQHPSLLQTQNQQINLQQPLFEGEDFFSKNMNILNDIGFGDFNNELQMFETQKNPAPIKINLPILNSLTLSAMNFNNNGNLNFFSNNNLNLNGTFQQQNNLLNSHKIYNLLQEEQQVTNSLQFFRISDKNDQKNPQNQSFQVEFDRQNEEQDHHMFDFAQTEDSVFHSNKLKIPNKKEHDDDYTDEEKQNEEGMREIKEFLNQINSLPNTAQSQKLKEFINNQRSANTCTSSSQEDTQTESNTFSSNNTASNLINSNQYFLKNLSQHQFV